DGVECAVDGPILESRVPQRCVFREVAADTPDNRGFDQKLKVFAKIARFPIQCATISRWKNSS
ncbi:hypothetical protein, partial [Pseudomonas amygdali]|uniref:hypothetical protein n=1 Tax=Pseudomonas amygdali TaxID=47877 RepID=UPI001EE3FF2A